jgi:purine-binding chemotaxis protein CheW
MTSAAGAEDSHHLSATDILRARARLLARPTVAEGMQTTGATLQLLEFRLAEERYALETSFVHEVHALKNLTPIPCAPAFVSGIVNVRGRLFTVVDLKKFFGLRDRGITDLHRVILIGAQDTEFGLLADISVGILEIPLDALQPPPLHLTDIGVRYIRGMGPGGLIVLNIPALLADPLLIVDEEPAPLNRNLEKNKS